MNREKKMANCIHWLFGRGASIGCNLTWVVPSRLMHLAREQKIAEIKKELIEASDHTSVDTTVYRKLLNNLSSRTATGWRHRFGTTNWDCLLQKEINLLKLEVLPSWLADDHVFHINGTIEEWGKKELRSQFLLEDDSYKQRIPTMEADELFNFMTWGQYFIVIGMSFECEMDRFLLASLKRVEDDLPIGNSIWLVLNPDKEALDKSTSRIQSALPRSKVYIADKKLEEWIDEGMDALRDIGAFAD
jgi:hypothetical protein